MIFQLAALVVCLLIAFTLWLIVWVRRIGPLMTRVAALEARIADLTSTVAFVQGETPTPTARPADAPQATPHDPPMHQVAAAVPPAPRPQSAPWPRTADAPQATSVPFEETLGTNWLNTLGAALLVLGVAFFLSYQVRQLGPVGKDLVGLVLGATLLAGGIVAERRTAYQVFSRGLMAGGWGLLFFTSFAMHHVASARVIASEPIGLALMLAVAAGMAAHALRYRSQVVTATALLFAFGTVTLSHDAAFTLTACTVLALTSAAISLRMKWVPLELGAMAATYANHFLWLPTLAATPAGTASPLFPISLALLACYWLIFRTSFVLRRGLSDEDERWATVGAAIGTCGLIVVANRYPIGSGWVAASLLILGAADACMAWLVRERRTASTALIVMASALVAASVPVVAGARVVSFAWFIEAEALVLLGVRTRDRLIARVGIAGTALAGLHLFARHVLPFIEGAASTTASANVWLAALFVVSAAVYYGNELVVGRRYPETFVGHNERITAYLLHMGSASLLALAWRLVPWSLVAPMWGILGLCTFVAALWMRERGLRRSALAMLLTAVARIALVDLWWLDSQERYVAFVALGAALMLVSYLYSRYRTRLGDAG